MLERQFFILVPQAGAQASFAQGRRERSLKILIEVLLCGV
jgi:hypothetical protein